jgi:hypothetical protein
MFRSRKSMFLHGVVATAALVPALLLAASPATAGSVAPPAGRSIVSPNSGSGTVNDPWVPSKSATVVCQDATLWGNYNGSTHSTPLGTVYYGDQLSVRYETSDHNSVMAYSSRNASWGYVLRSCVQFA